MRIAISVSALFSRLRFATCVRMSIIRLITSGILLRAERTRHDLGDPEAGNPPTHLIVVDAVQVSQQPSGSGVLGEGVDQLLGGPYPIGFRTRNV